MRNLPRRLIGWLARCLPSSIRTRLIAIARAAGKRLTRRHPAPPDDLNLQLDSVLRELRRLHVRMEELQGMMEGRHSDLPSKWESEIRAERKDAA